MIDIERLKTFKVFQGVKEEELKLISQFFKMIMIKQGEVIFDEGCSACSLCLILNGRVRIYKKMPGMVQELALLEQHDLFGEVSFVDNLANSATVNAAEDTVLAIMDQDSFNELRKQNPEVCLNFLMCISRELCQKFRAVNIGLNTKSSEYLIYELLASGQEVKVGTSSGLDYIGKIIYSGMSDKFPLIKVQVKDVVTILPFSQITSISLPNKFGKFVG